MMASEKQPGNTPTMHMICYDVQRLDIGTANLQTCLCLPINCRDDRSHGDGMTRIGPPSLRTRSCILYKSPTNADGFVRIACVAPSHIHYTPSVLAYCVQLVIIRLCCVAMHPTYTKPYACRSI